MDAALARVLATVGISAALTGCGLGSASPPRFSGYTRRGPVDSANVRMAPTLPAGYEAIGRIDARCRADDGVVGIDDESLADVDCSEALLGAAIREKAAEVGGEVLVGLTCRQSVDRRSDGLESTLYVCFANVAMPRDTTSTCRGTPAEGAGPVWRAEEAFDVAVSVRPVDSSARPRRAAPTERVAELAFLPIGRVVMGDIVARGPEADRAAVRHAVRAAAGRVGASDVVGIACVHDDDGWLCTGRATRPEVDEYAVR
jgi:hypothetical protein